jgi:AcrR family transcriptional regulator
VRTAPARRPRGAATRARILEAADEVFYDQGIRAVRVEDIIERAATTRMTLYRHFASKDDLVLAYLRNRASREREGLSALVRRAALEEREALLLLGAAIAGEAATEAFRGCPFLNAAGEYRDPEHPVRQLVAEHRAWLRAALEGLVANAEVANPARATDRLMTLRDGVMVGGYLGDAEREVRTLRTVIRATLAARR